VVIQYDANNQPQEMQVSVTVRFSLYDKVKNEFIFTNKEVTSTQSSTLAGRYYVDSGDGWTSAADMAMAETAKLIVRNIMVMK